MSAPQIAGFWHLEHLGSGGFADVFLYEQEWPKQQVAVKVVRADVELTDREKQLFTAEANALAQLADHPYIVSVITAGTTDDGRPYLVMRYCPPPDLGARVRSKPMAVADALSTGIKLAGAVETAHRAGMLHRDIKPSNVLVTTYGEPALTDFGIAAQAHELAGEEELRLSYPWAPPELVEASSNGSVASDVYSLGATVWTLLVGRSPFSIPHGDNSSPALAARILHSPAPVTQREDVPAGLDRLLQQCMSRQPAHRPASALELARGLQRLEAAAGLPRTPITVAGDAPAERRGAASADETHVRPAQVSPSRTEPEEADEAEPRPDGVRRSPALLAAGAAAVALALVAVLFWAATGSDDPDTEPPATTSDTTSTPLPIEPQGPVNPPVVQGRRTAEGLLFTWRAPDLARRGDTWEWRRTDTGEGARTDKRRLVVQASGRTCVQVRLIRSSSPSPWTEKCVR